MASIPAFMFATGIGLFDLNRRIRPVGEAYNKLIADWRTVLPVQSVCLRLPVINPQDYSEGCIVKWRETAAIEEEHIPTEPAETGDA